MPPRGDRLTERASARPPHRPPTHSAEGRVGAIPLVGRAAELATALALLDAPRRAGATLFVAGEGGVGKTRLAAAVADEARRRGWEVSIGRAYPVESGVPYALLADAFVPTLAAIEPASLQLLTRGGAADLAALFPSLARGGSAGAGARSPRGDAAELKARLYWSFSQLLARLAAKQPRLVVLENLQWADASSIELLHFVARQAAEDERLAFVSTYNESERDQNASLGAAEQSLVRLGAASTLHLEPLSREATGDLVARTLPSAGADAPAVAAFVDRLYEWTRGNPFFVDEALKALVADGRLVERGGVWRGWELADATTLPRSVRDAVRLRLDRLTPAARAVAVRAAVIGTRVTLDVLRAVCDVAADSMREAIDELRATRVMVDADPAPPASGVALDFGHPTIRDVLYAELGAARARALHGDVAEALERAYGERAIEHAGELATHYVRADARAASPKALRHLAAAGREALAASANREAASYLAAALEVADRASTESPSDDTPEALATELARARQRLGERDAAMALWARAREAAATRGDQRAVASIERRMGLSQFWAGRYDDALAHFAAGLDAAHSANATIVATQIHIARATCLLEIGRAADAEAAVTAALHLADRAGDAAVLARAHRASLLLHTWSGPPEVARRHGERALELASEASQPAVAWSAHWALAVLGGLTGDGAATARHLAASERIAGELRSPVLALWSAEVAIEYQSGIGEWEQGLAVAERAVSLARALGQRTLLPRLLVWGGLIHLGRGDMETAKAQFDEAWRLSRADRAADRDRGPLDVHSVLPAHVGIASYHLAAGDRDRAIEVGEAGLAIAERGGYVAWAVHRLLPVVGEAALWLADFDRAQRYGAQLREASRRLDHRLGLAWADACDALVALLTGDAPRAVAMLRSAADALDEVPFVLDAARLRRFLARALTESGDREGATSELRRVHDVLARLGATRELALTREQLRELGARPPSRSTLDEGSAGLSARELEICRLVAAHRSNKEIGAALDISPRTVSTHLSNVFAKLGVASRGELTDWVRQRTLE
ncbi:MAG TPA: AAA family ATPase [Gemmatimonadaceae bacterium]|nr:AAA family ATPase [Gemmatimonadaceae bacterium]